jgi:hypothetical protein
MSTRLEQQMALLEAALQAKLVESYVQLVEATSDAVDTLRYIMLHGRHEEARVSAAKEILDRANLTPDVRVVIQAGNSERETRLAELHRQLDAMQHGLTTPIDVEAAETA